jgi:hypothetical protein
VLFIDPEKRWTSGQWAYVRWFLPSGPKASPYVQVLSRGYSKSSVCQWSHIHPPVRFAERTSDGPHRTSAL